MPPRAAALKSLFETIAATRMAGVPVVRDGFGVHAVGFQPLGDACCGILVTPWFMNLVVLPADDEPPLAVGAVRARNVGTHRFDFIGASEPGFGAWEACSLFSPMFEFDDEAAALATAQAVLAELRQPPPAPPVQASRRALLFGSRA